jgi:hypothetical protein
MHSRIVEKNAETTKRRNKQEIKKARKQESK